VWEEEKKTCERRKRKRVRGGKENVWEEEKKKVWEEGGNENVWEEEKIKKRGGKEKVWEEEILIPVTKLHLPVGTIGQRHDGGGRIGLVYKHESSGWYITIYQKIINIGNGGKTTLHGINKEKRK
jgi:hypothetical protein